MDTLKKVNEIRQIIYELIMNYSRNHNMNGVYNINDPFEISNKLYATQFEVESDDPMSEEASIYIYVVNEYGETDSGKYFYELSADEMGWFHYVLECELYTNPIMSKQQAI
jgi:hypothetical protein